MMVKEMANSKALVCPLRKDRLNYCVGLSTIADAEGLNKPLIITRNPYHSNDRTKSFYVENDKQEWLQVINNIESQNKKSKYSIQKCYQEMKPFILKNTKQAI